MTQTISDRYPETLKPHPLIAPFPRWDPEGQEWCAFVDDIREHGVLEPLWITEGGLVVDGETRRRAAVEAGLAAVPCRVVAEEEVAMVVLRNLQMRRNLTKSQLAYVGYPAVRALHEAVRQRHEEELRQGTRRPNGAAPSVQALADQLGVGRQLFYYAAEIHALFERRPDLRERVEPTILGDERAGLGGVYAGLESLLKCEEREAKHGIAHTGGRPADLDRQLELFEEVFTRTLVPRFEYWSQWTREIRTEALARIAPALAGAPDDFLYGLERKIAYERKKRSMARQPGVEVR